MAANNWIRCARCSEPFVLHPETEATLRRSAQQFHCPWGHPQHFPLGDSEATILRRERDLLKQRLAQRDDAVRDARDRAERERNRANGYKGHATKLANRAKAGVCPCCNRSFVELRRHMATKHPDFAPPEVVVVDLVKG